MKQELINQLYTQMVSGLYPDENYGTCRVVLEDAKDSYQADISLNNNTLRIAESSSGPPDAMVKLSPALLSDILANADRFDLRDPLILAQIETKGNLALASFLFTLIKRPSAQIASLLEDTEQLTAGYRDSITAIKRVYRPSEADVLLLMEQSVPFVVTGALDNWPFVSKSLEQIKAEYGDAALRHNMEEDRQETLADFIEKMENNTNDLVYTFGCPLPLAIWADIELPFFQWDSVTSPQIWMGRRTGKTPCTTLHRDCTHNMLAHVSGRKKMILFSPDQSDSLYPVPAFNTFQPCSVRDVKHVDLSLFPAFAKARAIEVTLEPGELLVIPAFWFHCVYALDDVFSISFALLWDAFKKLNQN
ncbi:cupin-like domain-containing protein [Pedobacter cryoconitis]|uniref:Cupin-like domain-containing protein n=1 Tax=Pedobacter cryoconitis TaxID=188932 RepID=A0A327SES4_9SPHI|nr:cupin-like domain-containing protein [Pedobacter cryoconitis]RAJ26892.1 Cupin-like domain-containing protein [Pedobacter cryoconitis]